MCSFYSKRVVRSRTWQASHGRRPWLFVCDVPDKERRESNQSTKASIAYANVHPVDPHFNNTKANPKVYVVVWSTKKKFYFV